MKLSELFSEIDIYHEIINEDADFETLGFINSKLSNSFCTFLDSMKYASNISEGVAIIITDASTAAVMSNRNICVVDNPRKTFFELHNYLKNNTSYIRENYKTEINKNCKISNRAFIDNTNVIIGNNVIIEEFVVIKNNTIIKDNSIIRSGSIIGSDGFEFKIAEKGILSVDHLGGVAIGENVEIKANTCIDKAIFPWDNTTIGNDSKISNLVHISHCVKIEDRVLIAACTEISGSTIIGENTWISPNVSIINGIKIGKNCILGIGTVVLKDVEDNSVMVGNPSKLLRKNYT